MFNVMHSFLRIDRGTTAIEYGLIVALIVVAIIGSIGVLGQQIQNTLYSGLASLF